MADMPTDPTPDETQRENAAQAAEEAADRAEAAATEAADARSAVIFAGLHSARVVREHKRLSRIATDAQQQLLALAAAKTAASQALNKAIDHLASLECEL